MMELLKNSKSIKNLQRKKTTTYRKEERGENSAELLRVRHEAEVPSLSKACKLPFQHQETHAKKKTPMS